MYCVTENTLILLVHVLAFQFWKFWLSVQSKLVELESNMHCTAYSSIYVGSKMCFIRAPCCSRYHEVTLEPHEYGNTTAWTSKPPALEKTIAKRRRERPIRLLNTHLET